MVSYYGHREAIEGKVKGWQGHGIREVVSHYGHREGGGDKVKGWLLNETISMI